MLNKIKRIKWIVSGLLPISKKNYAKNQEILVNVIENNVLDLIKKQDEIKKQQTLIKSSVTRNKTSLDNQLYSLGQEIGDKVKTITRSIKETSDDNNNFNKNLLDKFYILEGQMANLMDFYLNITDKEKKFKLLSSKVEKLVDDKLSEIIKISITHQNALTIQIQQAVTQFRDMINHKKQD
jgi:hypothetical protein